MPINRILIANRGEIALRIVRACRDMGIESVQAYSTADADTLAVQLADESVEIGGPQASESYLRGDGVIDAARRMGVDAIHPGYGFLSESAEFAEACASAGIIYIGPQASIIKVMGDKAAAIALAKEADVPVTPGSSGPVTDPSVAIEIARAIGFPVLIKASAGGGGRGMRVVHTDTELEEALGRAAHEAEAAFGNGEVYLEKYLDKVRHIEIQVFGDGENVVHMGERDCSVQRRHQKLVEESPSPAISPALRHQISSAACRLAERVSYEGAGTLEFIVDADTEQFYFIEMNTRIQVEHPVTEEVTGLDLIKAQIRVAAGEPLGLIQENIKFLGHAIECRINAEDPAAGFMPRPGTITKFTVPLGPGIRVDTHAYPGYVLPPFYDSLLAKVVARGDTREEAIMRMKRALGELEIEGVPTTIEFHKQLLEEPDFVGGRVHTRFVKEVMWAGNELQHML